MTAITAPGHDRGRLLALAPLGWWEESFKHTRSGPNWVEAADALMRACEREGVFRNDRMRGRGVWPEDGGWLLHLGDRLITPGSDEPVAPESYKSPTGYTYDRKLRIEGPSVDPMGVDEYELHGQWERLVQYVATHESPISSSPLQPRSNRGARRK